MAYAFRDYPEVEYLSGKPYPKVNPKRTHSLVQRALIDVLHRCGARLGNTGPEWRFKLRPGTEFVPDVAFVSFERLRTLTDEQAEEPPFAPDIAIEVRSPSRRPAYDASKIREYLAHGSQLALDVDPKSRVIYAYDGDGATTFRSGDSFSHRAFPWLRFEVDEIFADLKIPR